MQQEKTLTGYPSIDKPWLKYYSDEAIKKKLIPNTIFGHLYENNKEHLDDIALIYFGKKITYHVLFNKIERCKNSLLALGIKKNDIVTIQTLAIPQTVVLLYALSRIGAVANLIYASNNEKEVNENLKLTGSKTYFVIDNIYEKFSFVLQDTSVKNVVLFSIDSEMDFLTKTVYRISKKKKQSFNKENVYSWDSFVKLQTSVSTKDVKDDQLPVAMTYTGGTTGTSKAVVLTNRSINELVFQYEKSDMGFIRQDVFMDSLPPFIAFGLTVSLHLPLCMGIRTVLIPDPTPQNQGKMFMKYKPNYYVAGPVQIEAIINYPKAEKTDFSFLKILATGGDALPASIEKHINDFLKAHNCKTSVFQGYGMSELAATVCTGSATIQRFGTVGIPLPNTNVKIIDTDTSKEVSYGQQGEVCIYAPSVMEGYYKNVEETDKILHKHNDGLIWVHTGDIGTIDEDGFLTIVGRIKRMILTLENGVFHKVFPKVLEEELLKVKGISAVSIVGKKQSEDSIVNDLVAFIVLENGTSEENILETMRRYEMEHLESYERPEKYLFVDQLPRTTLGKIDYRRLEKEAEHCIK